MKYLEITGLHAIEMAISAAILIAICIWAQSFRKKQRNIIGSRLYFFIFSAIIISVSLFSLFGKGLNYGLDFTGGTIIEVSFKNTITSEEIRNSIIQVEPSLQEAVIQVEQNVKPGEETDALIRTKELTNEKAKTVIGKLNETFKDVTIKKQETIGPVVGQELKKKAILALVLALLFQLIYITFRFGNQMRYGFAADIALAHDLIIMIGIYSLVGRPVDSPFIAAILTVIGYSVMDSIVIFDRIRENSKMVAKGTYEQIVNISVNQTMTRSINTLMTVLLCLFALYFFGGNTLKNFAFALLIGVTCGAYSSIFVASPLCVIIDTYMKKKEEERSKLRKAQLEKAAEEKAIAKAQSKPEKKEKKTMVTPLDENYADLKDMPREKELTGVGADNIKKHRARNSSYKKKKK